MFGPGGDISLNLNLLYLSRGDSRQPLNTHEYRHHRYNLVARANKPSPDTALNVLTLFLFTVNKTFRIGAAKVGHPGVCGQLSAAHHSGVLPGRQGTFRPLSCQG